MRLLAWLLRGFVLFTLFAFALNNEHPAVVNWFFGHQWRAPMVIVVMAAMAVGAVAGVAAASLPRRRRRRPSSATDTAAASAPPAAAIVVGGEVLAEHPPRVGL